MNLTKIECDVIDWLNVDRDRNKRRAVVNKEMNLQLP
jgi:hypothetical protein